MKHFKIYSTLILIFALSLLLVACEDIISAISVRLRKTEGDVLISDDSDENVEVMDDLLLFSGYKVQTRPESFAWLDFDSVKLGKMDESSKVAVEKDGGALKVDILEGNLFFHVTEPLGDDESMEIRTSTMVVGIRGTCGWVEAPEGGDYTQIYLLEGKVECSANGESVAVSAGETAFVTGEGGITVEKFEAGDIPDFVRDESGDDDDLYVMIQELTARGGSDDTGGSDDPGSSEVVDSGDAAGPGTLPISDTMDFCFSSGAGAWATVLELSPDGTFSGSYHDSNMGETGPGYRGTMHVCNFTGKFRDIRQKDEHTYSMTLDYYNTEEPAGKEWIEGVARYVAEEPFGIAGGETFELYLPGKPVASLTQDFLNGVNWTYKLSQGSTLSKYGFYNVDEGCGFFEN